MTLTSALSSLYRIVSSAISRGHARRMPTVKVPVAFPAPSPDAGAHWSRVSGLVAAAVETANAVGRAQAAAMEKIDAADYALAQLMDDLDAVLRPTAPALTIVARSHSTPMAVESSRIAA